MNEDFPGSMEERLRALRPSPLPPDLHARLLAVEPPPVPHRPLHRLRLAGLAGTLVLLLALPIVHRFHPGKPAPMIAQTPAAPQPSDFRVFLPTDRRSTLLDVSEESVVDAGPERQIRLVRAVWLDDTTYLGDDHSTLHRQTARTEIIPVALDPL